MSTTTNRLASYKKEDKQIIVALNAQLRDKWEGLTLGEIAQELGVEGDENVKFGYYTNSAGNSLLNAYLTKGDKMWIFNVSQTLADLWDDNAFEGNILDCMGRGYTYERPVMIDEKDSEGEFIMQNGRRKQTQKQDGKGQKMFETIPGFNIGKPQNYRKFDETYSAFEGEMSAEDAAKLLAGA